MTKKITNFKKQKSNRPLVSVIMPVYNGERFLTEAIESILNQTYKNLELVIVDDSSGDNSRNIIEGYAAKDKRIKVLLNKRNLGISKTLNKAILHAKGEFIARMDCDDISLPSRLERQVQVFQEMESVGVCGTWGYAIDIEGRKTRKLRTPRGFLLKYNYWKTSPLISSSTTYRKIVLDINKLFDGDLDTVEDYDMCLRLRKKCELFNLNEFLVCYRSNPKGVSIKDPSAQKQLSRKALQKNLEIGCETLDEYLSLVCFEFKLSFLERWELLMKVRKRIEYPLWMAVLDNMYYIFRKELFGLSIKQNTGYR